MLTATRLHGTQHSAHHGTADTDDRNNDDEPADGDRLRHHYAAAGLGLLFRCVVLPAGVPPGSVDRMAVLLTDTARCTATSNSIIMVMFGALAVVTAQLWCDMGLLQQ